MIEKEIFMDAIEAYKKGLDFLKKMDDMGLDFYDTPLCSASDVIFDKWLALITNEDGADLVYWWLFEDLEKKIYDSKGNETNNVEDLGSLYDYMKDNGYF